MWFASPAPATKGATIRVYLESYVPSSGDLDQDPQVALAEMISAINDLAEIKQRTGHGSTHRDHLIQVHHS